MVKNLPAIQETRVQFLGQEDPLEEKMATHSSILAWEIPWTEEPGGLQSMGSQRVRHNLATKFHFSLWFGTSLPGISLFLNTSPPISGQIAQESITFYPLIVELLQMSSHYGLCLCFPLLIRKPHY